MGNENGIMGVQIKPKLFDFLTLAGDTQAPTRGSLQLTAILGCVLICLLTSQASGVGSAIRADGSWHDAFAPGSL